MNSSQFCLPFVSIAFFVTFPHKTSWPGRFLIFQDAQQHAIRQFHWIQKHISWSSRKNLIHFIRVLCREENYHTEKRGKYEIVLMKCLEGFVLLPFRLNCIFARKRCFFFWRRSGVLFEVREKLHYHTSKHVKFPAITRTRRKLCQRDQAVEIMVHNKSR